MDEIDPLIAELPDRLRLPLDFDVAPLAADVARFGPEEWTRHFVRDNYEGEWSAVPLRCAEGETHPSRMIGTHSLAPAFADTRFLARAPALAAALARFRCPLKAVRLMKLGPGSTIKEHSDHDPDGASGTARLHVPIVTDGEVTFLLNHSPVPMAAGETWYLRLSDPHAVINRSATARIHLVLDVRVNDWLRELLRATA